jgi:hypothetical protein
MAFKSPAREVADYPMAERDRLRRDFGRVAARYRRNDRLGVRGLACFAVACIVAVALPTAWLPWSAAPVVLCFAVALHAMIGMATLACPGCANEIEHGFGPYCPECGSRHLVLNAMFRAPRCTACGKTMRRPRARLYTIRACTHCGLMLDNQGL